MNDYQLEWKVRESVRIVQGNYLIEKKTQGCRKLRKL